MNFQRWEDFSVSPGKLVDFEIFGEQRKKVLKKIITSSNKPGFHIAVRCSKVAAGIAGTIAAGMPQSFQAIWKPLLQVPPAAATIIGKLFLILVASSAMKFYIETGCLQQPPANHCLPLFYLSSFSFYPLVTGIVTGILRRFSHDGCGTIFRRFHLNRFTAVPRAWQMEDCRRLPSATLRDLKAIWRPCFIVSFDYF